MEWFVLGDSVFPIPGKVQAETLPRAIIKQGFKHRRVGAVTPWSSFSGSFQQPRPLPLAL